MTKSLTGIRADLREADGRPASGPILRGPSGKPLNLDNLSKRGALLLQVLKTAKIEGHGGSVCAAEWRLIILNSNRALSENHEEDLSMFAFCSPQQRRRRTYAAASRRPRKSRSALLRGFLAGISETRRFDGVRVNGAAATVRFCCRRDRISRRSAHSFRLGA